jgi:hypothetical protein
MENPPSIDAVIDAAIEAQPGQVRPHGLPESARAIYAFIIAYKTAHDGIPPSLREIVEECGIASTSVASYNLNKLQAAGLIRINPETRARNIEVVGGRWLPPGEDGHAG